MGERTVPGTRVALTIADSDSAGGSGIQADLKVFSIMDVYGASAVTAVTARNTTGVKHTLVLPPEVVEQQIDAAAGDLKIAAAKTGSLGSAANVEIVAKAIRRQNIAPLVVDVAFIAKTGESLLDDEGVKIVVKKLLPLAAVVTCNRAEAARLLGASTPINDVFAASEASRQICLKLGVRACVVTGTRRPNDQEGDAVDVYCDGKTVREIVSLWRPTPNTYGAGSTFSAAITAALALGQDLDQALQTAKNVVSEAIRQTSGVGQGTSPVNHLAYAKVKK